MKFTNISGIDMYLQCCHRLVEVGGSFSVSWDSAVNDRGLRAAMRCGDLAWESEDSDPEVPGSPSIPKPAPVVRDASEVSAAELAAKIAADNAGVSENMARMGNFRLPVSGDYLKKVEAVKVEAEVTRDDIISDESPKSLADIKKHNRAVRKFNNGGK